jgi:hypothetical protein
VPDFVFPLKWKIYKSWDVDNSILKYFLHMVQPTLYILSEGFNTWTEIGDVIVVVIDDHPFHSVK